MVEKIKSPAKVKPRPNISQKPALAELFPCKGARVFPEAQPLEWAALR